VTAATIPLTRRRLVILVTGLPLALALLAFLITFWTRAAVQQLASRDEVGGPVAFTAPVTGGMSKINIINANAVVRGGSGQRIRVRGQLTGSITRPSLGRQDGPGGLTLSPRCPLPFGDCSLSFRVSVPATRPVEVSSTFGAVAASGLRGQVTLANNSGSLTATRLDGRIRLISQFGSLTAARLSGSIQLAASSSGIIAQDLTGDTRVSDSFAAIQVTGLSAADVVASDTSGNIVLRFATVPRRVQVTDSFGSIWIVLPQGAAAYRVEASRPAFGSLQVSVPRSPAAAHVIIVKDSNGNISVTRDAS
jgi:hypothetical protein